MRGVLKWIIGIAVSLGIFGTIFWALFYSSHFANLSFIIPLRVWYQKAYWKTEGLFLPKQTGFPPFDPVYTIQAQTPSHGSNYYSFWGKFSRLDIDRGIIYLTSFDGKPYSFLVGENLGLLSNGELIPLDESLLLGTPAPKTKFEQNIVNTDDTPYTNASTILIFWDDKRTLYQIMNSYSKSPSTPLNQNSNKFFSLTKFN